MRDYYSAKMEANISVTSVMQWECIMGVSGKREKGNRLQSTKMMGNGLWVR